MKHSHSQKLPLHFVYLSDIDPSIIQDVRYATNNNFLGRPAAGYLAGRVIITIQAAKQLAAVQAELAEHRLSLKVFDGYRPQQACDDFWQWANDIADTKMKELYYPEYERKLDLFNGFIARYSSHSRGSAVDLTIFDLDTMQDLGMGGIFDFFGEISYTRSPLISEQASINREFLVEIMSKHGFDNYSKEWWHFNLIDEPYKRKPEDHFNFPVI